MSPHVPEVLVEASEVSTSSQEVVDEQSGIAVLATKDENESGDYKLDSDPDVVLVTGADAALRLPPLRDDFDKALTFRSIILASGLACFQAVMTQIYSFKPTQVSIQGTFLVLISYFIGNAWAMLLPRGDKLESRWRERGGQGKLPWWITVMKFVNHGPWSLKEHSICSITANSASNAGAVCTVFAAQNLFYDLPLNAATVILVTISIGLFGYGICGMMRPVAVWHIKAVYWINLPMVKTLQGLHWQQVKDSKPLRYFCGATSNEGLGLFGLSFDWQILLTANGTSYPLGKVFPGGVLDEAALAEHGLPRLTGTFAYAMLMANAAIGALIVHCILFWGKDILRAYQSARQGRYDDRHHQHMATHYQETPWWWYVFILVGSFVLGVVVIVKEKLTLPIWAYVVALICGCIVTPFTTILFSRFGNGIATNNLSKMLAGLMVPRHPIGNMYFAAWSHSVANNAVLLSGDLKMGEYLKIPPRIIFLTQVYGTMLGAFINYVIMISIVTDNRDLLVGGNGNNAWSGASVQAYNTNAASWALSPYIYRVGTPYGLIPIGLVIGAGAVILHRIVYYDPRFQPDRNQSATVYPICGMVPYNTPQTCVIFSQIIGGFYAQYYLRNYKQRIFKEFSYLVTAAFDGAALTVMFILSFAVLGAGGPQHPFPTWWGNNADGNYDWCPVKE
ncbi:Oligopeptide transporter OPT superfamily [Penicillium soppii]|uniref:Oligopeptide transporter OPT superfamily n=1 Tax=Penicillium soppii TaxID=69789 RepID=UPI0025495525|nr:Oligopeptide transporter OPT superfamily [Penicillium soppii]KAJ5882245.1 Oligopeptide transporter OPT superfamily [Penicillium soppii]